MDLEALAKIGTGDYPGLIPGEWIRIWTFRDRRFEVVGGVRDDLEFRVDEAVGVNGHFGVLGVLDAYAEFEHELEEEFRHVSVLWSQPSDCGHHRFAVTGPVGDSRMLLEIARGLQEG